MESRDNVHDVLVTEKSNTVLVFVLFSTEENFMSFHCCCFAKVLPSHFTESKDISSVLSISCVSSWNFPQLLVSLCSMGSVNNKEIKVNGQRLETVTSFKYLGSVITD